MVGEKLQDVDAEEFPPVYGEHCPRCDATLHDVEPHPDALACPDCEYRADLSGFDEMTLTNRALAAVLSRLWPETRTAAIVVFVVGALIGHWTAEPVLGGAFGGFAAFILYQYSPSTYCVSCGYSVATDEGFCANCGDTIDDVDAIVEDPEADDLLTRAWTWIDDRTPRGVTLGVPTIELETDRLDWVDRLLVGDRNRWQRVFDGGIVVMVIAQLAVAAGVIGMFWLLITADGGSSASSSGESLPDPTWDWLLPAVTFVGALVATVIVHELGHALSAAVDGYAPEKAGIVLTLGVPVIGWARNEDEGDEAPRHRLRILSAGILFNLVSGLAALGLAAGLGYPVLSVPWTSPMGLFLVIFGWLGLVSVPGNALPIGSSDGGQFIATIYEQVQEWRAPDPPSVPDRSLGVAHRLAEGYDG